MGGGGGDHEVVWPAGAVEKFVVVVRGADEVGAELRLLQRAQKEGKVTNAEYLVKYRDLLDRVPRRPSTVSCLSCPQGRRLGVGEVERQPLRQPPRYLSDGLVAASSGFQVFDARANLCVRSVANVLLMCC